LCLHRVCKSVAGLGGLIGGMMIGIVARELHARWRSRRKPIETICRELAELTTDDTERAALLEIAENYRTALLYANAVAAVPPLALTLR
jgi:hypothetical protein